MQGTRQKDNCDTNILLPGDYTKVTISEFGGTPFWIVRTPRGHLATIGRVNHTVTENSDGTISVSPSIAPPDRATGYHGFLVNGVWSDDIGDRL